MSLRTKIAAAACAALVIAGALATPAEAKGKKFGPALGLGIVAGTMLGVAAASGAYDPYHVGYGRRCRFVDQYNAFGIYLGTTRVCRW